MPRVSAKPCPSSYRMNGTYVAAINATAATPHKTMGRRLPAGSRHISATRKRPIGA